MTNWVFLAVETYLANCFLLISLPWLDVWYKSSAREPVSDPEAELLTLLRIQGLVVSANLCNFFRPFVQVFLSLFRWFFVRNKIESVIWRKSRLQYLIIESCSECWLNFVHKGAPVLSRNGRLNFPVWTKDICLGEKILNLAEFERNRLDKATSSLRGDFYSGNATYSLIPSNTPKISGLPSAGFIWEMRW